MRRPMRSRVLNQTMDVKLVKRPWVLIALSPLRGSLHPCRERPEWCAGPILSKFLLPMGRKPGGATTTRTVTSEMSTVRTSSGVRALRRPH